MNENVSELEKHFVELTSREAEILALLAEGLSDQEIADRLTVAYTTVKWYNRQIYNKLGVEKRRQAIQRATSLGLLDTPETAATPKSNLPTYTTPFVGRQHELEDLARLLQDKAVRLITILAPGGMGKTHLALEATQQESYNFPNSVFFVPLQPLADVEQIIPVVAHHIGFQFIEDVRSPKQQLLDYFGSKKMLLILDNWEHLLDGATVITEILQAAPGVKVLATSREKLNLSGETVYELHGMQFSIWEAPEDALQCDAVKLLVQAARRVRPDFAVTTENLDYVAHVCRLTEGMPLGILLATGWLDVFSLERVAEEIQKNVDFLETEMRDVPERQRSIRAVFESAWERLEPADQQVFMKLSVFRGGCTPEAAEALTGATPRTLQTLINKALVLRTKTGRYDIHELLRQYSYERLEASGNLADILHQHSLYFADFLHQREDSLKSKRQIAAIEEIEPESDNIRQGWYQALQGEDIGRIEQSLFSLAMYSSFRSRLDFIPLFTDAEATLRSKYATHRDYGRLLAYYGDVLWKLGRNQLTESLSRRALLIALTQDDPKGIAFSALTLGRTLALSGNGAVEEFEQFCDQSIRIFETLEDAFGLADALHFKGYVLAISGKNDEALAISRQTLDIRRQIGDEIGMADSLYNIAVLFENKGHWDEYEALTRKALALRRHLKQPAGLALSLRELGFSEFQKGNIEACRKYTQESLQIALEITHPRVIAKCLVQVALIAIVSDQFDEAEQKLQEAMRLALSDIRPLHLLFLGFARLGRRDWVGAKYALIEYLKQSVTNLVVLPESLLGMGLMMAEERQTERGLELAALALNHLQTTKGLANSPLVSRHLEAIKSQLTEEAYAAAWERGKGLKLEDVVAELLAEESRPPDETR